MAQPGHTPRLQLNPLQCAPVMVVDSAHLSWLLAVLVSPTTELPGCASFHSLPK